MKKTPLVLIALLGLAGNLAQAAGTAAGQFLKLGAGARAAGMGDAFTAIANDATAAYWNPAGLHQIETPEISVMQNNWMVDTQYQYLGGALPMENHTFALSIYRMDFGSIEGYDKDDNRTGSFDASSLAAAISWSTRINDRVAIGLTGAAIQESIENEKAATFAGDAGVFYKGEAFSLGAVVKNLGGKLTFVDEAEELPQTLRIGAARSFFGDKLLLALDYEMPSDNDASIHAGAEYGLGERFHLRGGYRATPGNELDVDGSTGLTAGVGLTFERFSVDYAFVPFGELDSTHRFSLNIQLNRFN